MPGHGFPEGIENRIAGRCSPISKFSRSANKQLGVHLLRHAAREIRRGALIHRHSHRPAQDAAEKRRHPFRGIPSPEQDPVAWRNSEPLKLPRALRREARDLAVGRSATSGSRSAAQKPCCGRASGIPEGNRSATGEAWLGSCSSQVGGVSPEE